MDVDLSPRSHANIPYQVRKALEHARGVERPKLEPIVPVICDRCGLPTDQHPHALIICGLMSTVEKERDAMIEAIKAHRESLSKLGIHSSPDDNALWNSMPVWARQVQPG
jgi:hypothetical protein